MRPRHLAARAIVVALVAGSWVARASQAAPQNPTFRGGTDLMTVDVTVLGKDGRPVEDLAAGDFTVRIDGKTRKVVAMELVRATASTTAAAPSTVETHPSITTNAGAAGAVAGRRILIAIDQTYIAPGGLKPVMNAAAAFVNRLAPADQAALIVFPDSPIRVDFTADKARIVAALQELIGLPQEARQSPFNIGMVEAITIVDKERHQLPEAGSPEPDRTPVMAALMERGCDPDPADPTGADRCRLEIVAEASQIVQTIRTDARRSIAMIQSLIEQLTPIDGPKSLVLISSSLAVDDRLALDTLIRAAAGSRTSLNVLQVGAGREDSRVDVKTTGQAPREMEDRRLREFGLEELAGDGRGALYRVAGSGEGVFNNLATELSASYVLGVESLSEDKAGAVRKLEVSVRRPGARVRTSHATLRAPARARSMEDNLRDVLSVPTSLNDLRVRMTTFTQWDPGSAKVRVNVAAQLAAAGDEPSSAIVGYVVTDRENRTVAGATQKHQLQPSNRANGPAQYATTLLLDPGTYSLRLGVVDGDGKRGTVTRELAVRRSPDAGPAASDLIVGNPPASGQPLRPDVEPRITSGRLAAYVELYAAMPEDLDWTLVHVEIARDVDGEALASEAAEVLKGAQASWRIATATVGLESLAPGRYVARARIVDDDKTIAVLSRPFILGSPGSPANK